MSTTTASATLDEQHARWRLREPNFRERHHYHSRDYLQRRGSRHSRVGRIAGEVDAEHVRHLRVISVQEFQESRRRDHAQPGEAEPRDPVHHERSDLPLHVSAKAKRNLIEVCDPFGWQVEEH